MTWAVFLYMSTLQFSDTSTKLGIIQSNESNCLLGDAGISGNSALLKEFTRHNNRANSQIWSWIFESYGGMKYDDSNQTNLPSATDTLTSGQVTYPIPSGAISVAGVEVKGVGGSWMKLNPITLEQIQEVSAENQFYNTSATPLFYRVVGQTIKIYPAANWTQAASWRVLFDRGSVAFASTDTTATPGFISEFHDAVPVGGSLFWMAINKPGSQTLQELKLQWMDFEKRIKFFYGKQFRELFPPRMTVRDATVEFS